MDAVMVVHQLQRLASAPDPSPAVVSKLPRMAIGLSFFIDHPEIGVRQQAAKAVLLVCKQHASLLRDTPEGRELLSTLTRHAEASSTDANLVVLDCCKDAIRALEDAGNIRGKREDEGGENKEDEKKENKDCTSPASSHHDRASPAHLTNIGKEKHGSSSEGKRQEDHDDHVETKRPGDREEVEEDESMRNSGEQGGGCSPSSSSSSSSFHRSSSSVVEGVMYTVLLGLRGLIVDVRRLRKEQEEKERKKHCNNLNEKLPTAARSSSTLSSFSSTCLSKESRTKALLDELQKQLQYRLVCVPGVSSATITLNIRSLARQLEKEGEEEEWASQREKKVKGDRESDEGKEDRKTDGGGDERCCDEEEQETKKKDADIEGRSKENDDERDEEEGDGVAVLLMRLSSSPKQRLQQLHQVKESAGPLTLVLRAERIYSAKESHRDNRNESSRNTSGKNPRSRAQGSQKSEVKRSNKHCDNSKSPRSKEERRGRKGAEGREERTSSPLSSCLRDKPSRRDGEEEDEEDLSLQTPRRSSHPEGDLKDHQTLHCNDSSSFLAGVSSTQASSPAYLDEETLGGEQDEADGETAETGGMYGSCRSGEGLHGTGETAAGYSFFSRNSVLFTQSRFLGSSILPYEDEPELAARLKREKEKKAEERMRQLQSQNTLDRVLGSIGKVRFW